MTLLQPGFPTQLNKNPGRLRRETYGHTERSAQLPFRRSASSVFLLLRRLEAKRCQTGGSQRTTNPVNGQTYACNMTQIPTSDANAMLWRKT